MDASKVGPGDLVAGASGLALFVFLFIDWLGPLNAWQLLDFMDIVLAVIGLGVAAIVAARAAGRAVNLPGGPAASALAGFSAFWITITILIEGDERKIGMWLALLAAIGITYGGLTAIRGRPGAAPRAGTPPPPPAA